MVNGFVAPDDDTPHFTRGYGLVFGMSERKARRRWRWLTAPLQAPDYGEQISGPAQDEEFVLAHADNVEAAGFASHPRCITLTSCRTAETSATGA